MPKKSRERHEMSESSWWDDGFGKGPTDPDVLGYYPGSPEDPHMKKPKK